jgi:hypothetical protein
MKFQMIAADSIRPLKWQGIHDVCQYISENQQWRCDGGANIYGTMSSATCTISATGREIGVVIILGKGKTVPVLN